MGIRRASAADADRIAEIHVQAYDESYRDIAPPEAFTILNFERRQAQWRGFFATPHAATSAHVAESHAEVVGFCTGLAVEGGMGWIKTLYVLRKAQRFGLGRALMTAVLDDLATFGSQAVRLDVADGNIAADAFYRSLGGFPASRQVDPGPVWKSPTTTYEWADLGTLRRMLRRD
jgi:ribosomal protein S18 acetylase RimI-like enzyme